MSILLLIRCSQFVYGHSKCILYCNIKMQLDPWCYLYPSALLQAHIHFGFKFHIELTRSLERYNVFLTHKFMLINHQSILQNSTYV